MIFNHLELVVKMNNLTRALHNSNFLLLASSVYVHIISICVWTVHLCMTDSVKDLFHARH